MRRLLLPIAFIALTGQVSAANLPALEKKAATICEASRKEAAREWQPTQAQVRALENALGSYFASVRESKANLPAPDLIYARQYSGVVLEGRKLIHGRFYPSADPAPSFVKSGECWVTSDGGNRHWDVYFDPKTGRVISHRVNGVA